MNKRKILVVEDDLKTAGVIDLYLRHAGYDVQMAHDGGAALLKARNEQPDLIVLDLMLPNINGLDVCRILRAEVETPIIMLTARTTEDDKLRGLDLGADDYITKPFSPRELVARVKAVLRRSGAEAGRREKDNTPELRYSDLVVDLARHKVTVKGVDVGLTPTEFKILEVFVRAPERAFTRRELVERAFGWDYSGLDRTVDAHVMNLRKKINRNRNRDGYISTVFGIGYKFVDDRDAA